MWQWIPCACVCIYILKPYLSQLMCSFPADSWSEGNDLCAWHYPCGCDSFSYTAAMWDNSAHPQQLGEYAHMCCRLWSLYTYKLHQSCAPQTADLSFPCHFLASVLDQMFLIFQQSGERQNTWEAISCIILGWKFFLRSRRNGGLDIFPQHEPLSWGKDAFSPSVLSCWPWDWLSLQVHPTKESEVESHSLCSQEQAAEAGYINTPFKKLETLCGSIKSLRSHQWSGCDAFQ